MLEFWNKGVEKRFFTESVRFATAEQLFYVTYKNRYLAYWPKNYDGKKSTLQSRNALIGNFQKNGRQI